MKHLLLTLALLGSAPGLQAQTPPKILIIDLGKIFANHWKILQEQTKMSADEAVAQKELDRIGHEGEALVEQLKELDETTKSPTASSEAKSRAMAEAQTKSQEVQRKKEEQNEFAQKVSQELRQRINSFKTVMYEEISKTAGEVAKRHGATLLLDKSGPTMAGISNIVYYDPSLEITDEVLVEVNKTRPANLPTPTPAAGVPAAPEAGAAPTITVPGLTPGK
jgi:outer membrane protein